MTFSNLKLERATLHQIPQVTNLVNSAYRGESSKRGWTTEADFIEGVRITPKTLQQSLSDETRVILVARDIVTDQLVGCVELEFAAGRDKLGCYLGMLTVEPSLQNSGVGRFLLKNAEQYAKTQGSRYIVLGVINIRDTLIQWYERRDYKKTGEIKIVDIEGIRFDKIGFQKLYFVFLEKFI